MSNIIIGIRCQHSTLRPARSPISEITIYNGGLSGLSNSFDYRVAGITYAEKLIKNKTVIYRRRYNNFQILDLPI